MDRAQYDWLEQIVGQPIAESAPDAWGFRNRTELLTLADGERVVLQRYRGRASAERRARVMLALREPAALRGIVVPRIRHFDLDADPAWIVFDALPGLPVSAHVEMGYDSDRFGEIAVEMGRMLAAFRRLPTAGLVLDGLWSDPDRLATRAKTWAAQLVPELPRRGRAAVDAVIAELPALFAGRQPVLAHGDYGLVNVLSDGTAITGLLDFESVRMADRLFDPAWWAWSVGFAGEGVLEAAWPEFLAAARIDLAEPQLPQRIRALQVVRSLELLTERVGLTPNVARMVRDRLVEILA
ncbi:aminoglycoside phosphotransferase family protein [Nocardia panacis]|uniref:Aminoglycoside phosphotransferase family protein n=1 Tax=Nocardia panacis TaxID=2340916 RepID=A0A3A4KSK7_9NOCA|nr:aminoglycoside phosphotransferase family protein [Nocardia panacis]RJO79276.1 aminoglycoside phosphotransferase family protein [Nocardia panacis]